MQNINTGNYIVFAGIIASVLSHYGVDATTDQIASVIGAIAIVYGVIHQFIVSRKVANLAKQAGVKGF
jgi:hypothetical protein